MKRAKSAPKTGRATARGNAGEIPADPPSPDIAGAAADSRRPRRRHAAAEIPPAVQAAAESESPASLPPASLPADNAAAAPAEAAPTPPIFIHIDPVVSGGFIHGRFDMQVRGRVVAEDPVEAVELFGDGVVAARASFGQPERAPTITLPDGSQGRLRTFQLTLPRPQSKAEGLCSCMVTARTSSGHTHAETYFLEIDPPAAEPVAVRSGPTLASAHAGVRPQIILYVERALLEGDGNLTVHGWVVSFTPVVTVQVFAGEHERLPAAQLGGQRDDVADFYSGYPNARMSGFTMSGQIDHSARSLAGVRVQAVNRTGFTAEVVVPVERVAARTPQRPSLPAEPAAVPPSGGFSLLRQEPTYQITAGFRLAGDPLNLPLASGVMFASPPMPVLPVIAPAAEPAAGPAADPLREIHYYCDEAVIAPDGTLGLDGWAVCGVGIAEIAIHLGREKVGAAELGLPRPDVGENFADIPMAPQAGFRFRQRFPDFAEGEHSVRIVVRNGVGDVHEETRMVAFRRSAVAPSPTAPSPPPPVETETPEFRFELDSPQVVDDAAPEPITGRLTIEGWVLARSGVSRVEVFFDDQRLGEAHYGLARQDVGAAFPDWDNALRSGYAFHCPPRSLRDGSHKVRIVVRANTGQEMVRSFTIDVKRADDSDGLANIRRRISRAEANVLNAVLAEQACRPDFALVLRQAGEPDRARLAATIESLRRQVYDNWRLTVLAETGDHVAALRDAIEAEAGEHAGRVAVIGPADAAFDTPLGVGTEGALVGLLCPGDELAVDALAEIALAGARNRNADLLYADEARISPASHDREPFFKPDFSPDLLLSTNYIGRPWFAAAALLQRVGATPRSLVRHGEYDLVLRCTEQADAIHHVPKLLAQRGAESLDSDEASVAALSAAAARRGIDADVMEGCLDGTWRFRRMTPASGKVAIIIPTCAAHGYIEQCIASLRVRTEYTNYEIVCLDNIPESQMAWKVWLQQSADRVIDIPDTFNWSRFNNIGAAATDSEYLLFLNDDIEITQDDWLDVLLEHMQRPEVGVVGPQLLYPTGKVQHAGMFLGAGIGRHAFRFAPADDPGYFGLALTQRNVIAVTGACMLMRRSFFAQMGGFDEAHSVINNDLDFCLRTHQAGKLVVYTPHASLIHHELASRERLPDVFDTSHFNTRWKTLFAAGDPFFSPALSRFSDDYRPDEEAAQSVYAAHPLFQREDVHRILVVKLDHIGDFVTALPAIRRLKAMFPQAQITVLAGRHAHGFADMEPAIDEFLEFEFFHARSQLGERELTQEDFEGLRTRLAPYRFDLAVDLRKHLSTRDVLQYTGARFLAGYDYMGQCPYLDIALEWEGDKNLQRKRSHIVDDLLALIEAIGTACGTDRNLLPALPPRPDPKTLPEAVRGLFEKPVVAMHIGAGNLTKTWPAEYFSALIDLLTARNAVNVMLIGGPDDREASDALRTTLLRPERVASMAGEVPLGQLPRLLSACCLYIGNDSGPKHIAAALGVATIGIHSGVVDAIEWGPVGRRAVALRRNMTCSPCYLARAEDCPRSLSCLRHLEPSVVYQTAAMLLPHDVAIAAADIVDAATPAIAAAPVAAAPEPVPLAEPASMPPAAAGPPVHDAAAGQYLPSAAGAVPLVADGAAAADASPVTEPDGNQAPDTEPAPLPLQRTAGRVKSKPRGRRQRARA